jgi:hypothetical protein
MKRKNYDDVLDAINDLVESKKAVKQKVADESRDLLLKYTKDYFSEVEDLIRGKVATYELLLRSFTSYKVKIRSIDPGANIITKWNIEELGDEKIESINSVKIIWSSSYSAKNNIDREMTIDHFDCILRG